jgi:hypothetical protein
VNTAAVYLFTAEVETMADHDHVIDGLWLTGFGVLLWEE